MGGGTENREIIRDVFSLLFFLLLFFFFVDFFLLLNKVLSYFLPFFPREGKVQLIKLILVYKRVSMEDEYSTENLLAAGVDTEWIELQRWIRTFRTSQNKITSFLDMCGLDPSNKYYKKLCSLEMAIVYRPSLRIGTSGETFRNAATKLMFDSDCHSLRKLSLCESIENSVADWKIDNFKALMCHGVRDVFVTGTSHVKYYVVERASFTRGQFIDMMSSDPYLQGQLTAGELTVEEVRCQLLLNHVCVGINGGVSS